jgi:hypothetical protein
MLRPLLPSRIPSLLSPQCIRQTLITKPIRFVATQTACLHLDRSLLKPRPIPSPSSPARPPASTDISEDIPDVKTFLERIGRDAAKECEDKITVLALRGQNANAVDLGSVVQSEWQVFKGEGDSCAVETVHLTADG